MRRALQGRYVRVAGGDEPYKAFVPSPLPPAPPIEWSSELRARFDGALVALGKLDSMIDMLPNAPLLLHGFVRKEAVLTSMIEGTRSTLTDLLLYEVDEESSVSLDDVREVSRYVAAAEHGFKRLRGGFPLSIRLLREVHEVLLGGGRRPSITAGEFRRTQVWLGGSRPGNAMFVPPPATEVAECLTDLERFINDLPEPTPPLVKAALAHVQFETIHPFLDGNGRVGRLFIALQLASAGLLREPLLCLSLPFKQHRSAYYDLLYRVRVNGDWEAWLEFFADAVRESATDAVDAAKRLLKLASADSRRIETLGRATSSALAIHRALQRQPIATSASLGQLTKLTPATVNKTLEHLAALGIVTEITRKKRGRIFSYSRFNKILNEGMALPQP